ncbi:MAG: outer membrane lipoprotein-sorting protein [Bernardetiaceae bacterium]|nr:outer membrane lipoprotein-sorting protein [Bernardetiaceae bacterium]
MKKLSFTLAILALVFTSQLAQAQTVDEILAKYFANIGGVEKWKAMKSSKMEGNLILVSMGGLELPMISYGKAPNKVKSTVDFQGMTVVAAAYDGTTAWNLMPPEAGGSGSPTPLPEEAAKEVILMAEIESEFIDYAAKGHTVVLEGSETIEGTDCFKIKVTKKNGKVLTYFFEKENYVPIMMRTVMSDPMMGQAETDTFMSDYKEVDGLMMPHAMEFKVKGQTIRKMVFTKVSVNVELADDIFAMPAK